MMRARGFTLVELLVSLAILGLVAVLLMVAIGTGRRVWERMDTASAKVASVEAAQTIVRDRLTRVVPLTRYDASAPYADMDGKSDVLFFIAPASPERQPDALMDYRLSLSTGSDLVLSSTSDIARVKNPPRDDRVLLRNVARIEFAYFGVAPPDNTRRWRDTWYQRASPPVAVRLRLAFARGDARLWPDLIVRPAATVDTQCVLNNQTGQCKGR